jgi:magnesium transporter
MFTREILSGLAIGLALALIALPLLWWRWGDPGLALGVGISLFAACSTATLVAMTLPWALERAGADPAFGSGPLVTVIQDLLSIAMYFAIVTGTTA